MCSAPQNSGTSVMRTVPPCATRRSAAYPSAGLADRPENPSDPPHFTPSTSSPGGPASCRADTELARRHVRPARVVHLRQHRRDLLESAIDDGLRATELLNSE